MRQIRWYIHQPHAHACLTAECRIHTDKRNLKMERSETPKAQTHRFHLKNGWTYQIISTLVATCISIHFNPFQSANTFLSARGHRGTWARRAGAPMGGGASSVPKTQMDWMSHEMDGLWQKNVFFDKTYPDWQKLHALLHPLRLACFFDLGLRRVPLKVDF